MHQIFQIAQLFRFSGLKENKKPSPKAKVNFPSHRAETHISINVSYVCKWENHFHWSYFIISIQPLQTKFTFIYNTGFYNYIEDALCILLTYFVEIKCFFIKCPLKNFVFQPLYVFRSSSLEYKFQGFN